VTSRTSGKSDRITVGDGPVPADAATVLEELERVCAGPAFRSSKRSCEFLRHIVRKSLDHEIEALKERTIGVELMGRDSSYDTGSDATVRVRANEVRRRLQAHYLEIEGNSDIRIDLPTGTYAPRIHLVSQRRLETAVTVQSLPQIDELDIRCDPDSLEPLSLQHRFVPALIALFLCAICLRAQFIVHERFREFWSSMTENQTLVLDFSDKSSDTLSPSDRLRLLTPLLATAGQFHLSARIATPGEAFSARDRSVVLTISQAQQPSAALNIAGLDKTASDRLWSAFTMTAGTPLRLRIEGADYQSLQTLVNLLTDPDTFPEDLRRPAKDMESVALWMLPKSGHKVITNSFASNTVTRVSEQTPAYTR
jgi:hypothetical protein